MFDWLETVLHDAVAGGQAPGVVAAVARGDESQVAGAGLATLGGAPMRRDTIFRISSMTKPITAACALTLVDAGQVALDQPVQRWLPELASRRVLRRPDGPLDDTVPAERPVMVRDLLTSTWGFGMQGAMFMSEHPWPVVEAAEARALHTLGPPQPATTPEPDVWMARLGELPLLAQPGERWLYQSSSQVLGVLAERVAGKPLDALLSERVLRPLGMVDTGFWTADTARLATAYQRQQGVLAVSDPSEGQWSRRPAFCDGAGGLVSTADDLLRFGRMLGRGGAPVLRRETAAEMTRNQLTLEQRERVWPGFSFLDGRGWGFGLSVRPDGAYGWEGGFGTSWCNVPGDDLTVVVLTQRAADETGMPAVCEEVLAAARAL
ncbi:MAG: beta-lactamase family protein [Candidatus Dormibacteraeota bacterium]|nr:beta-lactamase family protein [Candidatus Dormibacteraeota bacterium]